MGSTVVATSSMVAYCFVSLLNKLDDHSVSPIHLPRIDESLSVDGLFVTWYERIDNHHQWALRGCIGRLKPTNLANGLREYSVIAATKDPRFPPISKQEVHRLKCTVSILLSFEICSRWDDWVIGRHGVIVRFSVDGKIYSATFLPQVMVEQNWNQQDAILAAIDKSGYKQKHVSSVAQMMSTIADPSTFVVTRYQTSTLSLRYDEWAEMKHSLNTN